MRQAFAGMLWSKQLYYYDVRRWLDGDPGQPARPPRGGTGRNARWRSFNAFDIMSMPDKWEYPWFAAWDLAFHCVALAHVDPGFAKYQLTLLCREWFQHPNGALPAYEWDFGDVNPPVQAWAALEVFAIDGGRDIDFLSRVFDKLLLNFTWWVNLEDADGSNLFEGGFLGLDNIGPLDRSHLPPGSVLEQSDATGWMATYALAMGVIAPVLRRAGQRPADDLVQKFLEHFAAIRDGDRVRRACGTRPTGCSTTGWPCPTATVVPVKVRSMVGIIPMLAAGVVDEELLDRTAGGGQAVRRLPGPGRACATASSWSSSGCCAASRARRQMLLGVVGIDRLERLFEKLFDPAEFLSPYGLRALSAYHREHPYVLERRRDPRRDRLRARRVHHRDVRRQLQLAGPGLVPAELPGGRGAGPLPPVLRRRLHRRVPHRVRAAAAAGRRRPRPVGQADLDLPASARTGGGRASAGWTACSTTRGGRTTSCSPSTSTATTAPGSGPRTRPAGPAWSPTSSVAATAR